MGFDIFFTTFPHLPYVNQVIGVLKNMTYQISFEIKHNINKSNGHVSYEVQGAAMCNTVSYF